MLKQFLLSSLCLLLTSAGIAQTDSARGFGTAFAVSDMGHLLTSFHLVREAKSIVVYVPSSERRLNAQVLAVDEANDLALLKVSAPTSPLTIVEYADVPTGIEVFGLGFPQPSVQGQSLKITSGILNSREGLKGDKGSFQFSASIQRGNSGGPVLLLDGGVIGLIQGKLGIVSAAVGQLTEVPQNVNFATNSQRLKEFLSAKAVPFSYRGVRISEMLRPHQIYDGAISSIFALEVTREVSGSKESSSGIAIPPPIQVYLRSLNKDEQAELLGALAIGFDSLYRSAKTSLLFRSSPSSKEDSQNERSRAFLGRLTSDEALLEFVLSLQAPRFHPSQGFQYRSVIMAAGLNCESAQLRVVFKEYKEQSFGSGKTLLKLLRKDGSGDVSESIRMSSELKAFVRKQFCSARKN